MCIYWLFSNPKLTSQIPQLIFCAHSHRDCSTVFRQVRTLALSAWFWFSFFYCMSSSSFAVVRRLVLFRVRQNQVTKKICIRIRQRNFVLLFSFFLYFSIVRFVTVIVEFVFETKSISVWRESEWVFHLYFSFQSFLSSFSKIISGK